MEEGIMLDGHGDQAYCAPLRALQQTIIHIGANIISLFKIFRFFTY